MENDNPSTSVVTAKTASSKEEEKKGDSVVVDVSEQIASHPSIKQAQDNNEKSEANLQRAQNLNTAIGLFFLITIFTVLVDYGYNWYEYRKDQEQVLLDFEKKYQSKEDSKQDLENFKACVRMYGLASCVQPK
jgi:hypothetical protein